MPKKTVTKEDIYADRLAQLTQPEREQLKQIMTSDLFVKFLRIVECKKPSAHLPSICIDGNVALRSTIVLSKIAGWEEHQSAMLSALLDPVPAKQKVVPNYPNQEPV